MKSTPVKKDPLKKQVVISAVSQDVGLRELPPKVAVHCDAATGSLALARDCGAEKDEAFK